MTDTAFGMDYDSMGDGQKRLMEISTNMRFVVSNLVKQLNEIDWNMKSETTFKAAQRELNHAMNALGFTLEHAGRTVGNVSTGTQDTDNNFARLFRPGESVG